MQSSWLIIKSNDLSVESDISVGVAFKPNAKTVLLKKAVSHILIFETLGDHFVFKFVYPDFHDNLDTMLFQNWNATKQFVLNYTIHSKKVIYYLLCELKKIILERVFDILSLMR